MKYLYSIILVVILQQVGSCCSFSTKSFCSTVDHFEETYNETVIFNGFITASDADGINLEVLSVLKGQESKNNIRIWDGTDFDCNGFFSMAAADFGAVGDTIIVILPKIDSLIEPWDRMGDYRRPNNYWDSPLLRVTNKEVSGWMAGYLRTPFTLGYDYFVSSFFSENLCDEDYDNVHVSFFYDQDLDGRKDWQEFPLPIGSVLVQGQQTYQNFTTDGFSFFADNGPLLIEYIDDNPAWVTTGDSRFEYEVSDIFGRSIRIGLAPSTQSDYIRTVINSDRFRCSEDVNFYISAERVGSAAASGTLWLELDSRVEDYNFTLPPDQTRGEHAVGWDYTDLEAGEILHIDFVVTAPPIENNSQVGQFFNFRSYINDNLDLRSAYYYSTDHRCSYDPNDKQVNSSRDDNLALLSSPIIYTIRFQNTGNDYARNILLTDTLDQALDLKTFDLLSTSHPENLTVSFEDNHAVKFEYKNIFLQDSITNEPESHGYLTYSIRTKEAIPPNTIVENTAFIYFDFNPPIVTNTTINNMVNQFPSDAVLESEHQRITMYPNPVNNELYFSEQVDETKIYDLQGQCLVSALNVKQVDTSNLVEGLYLVETLKRGMTFRAKVYVAR